MNKIIFLLLICFSLSSGQQYFNKYRSSTLEFKKESLHFFYDKSIKIKTARILYDYFISTYGEGRIPSFYAMPKSKLYLVSFHGNEDSLDYGYRLFFVKIYNDSVNEIYHTKGAGESWFLEPVYFQNKEHLIILAEYGEENTEGFLSIEYSNNCFRELGYSDLTILVKGNYGRPTDNVKIRYSKETYYLDFTADVVLNPLTKEEKVINKPKAGFITFYFNGQIFVQSN
jgi:hypothetical protein